MTAVTEFDRSAIAYLTPAAMPPPAAGEVTFRERWWSGAFGMGLGFGGVAISSYLWFTNPTSNLTNLLYWFGAAFLVLIGFIGLAALIRALRPSNWLCRIGHEGIWLHLRSYLNATRDDGGDETVVWLPWRAIRAARVVKRREVRPRPAQHVSGGYTKEIEWVRFLDLKLGDEDDAEELRQRLAAERASLDERKRDGMQFHHWPIAAIDDGFFRVAFLSRNDRVAPSIGRAEAIVSRHVPTVEVRKDDKELIGDDAAAREARIREFIRRGDNMAAIRALRIAHGMTLEEAKARVDAIDQKQG